jgi:hypothetical protein
MTRIKTGGRTKGVTNAVTKTTRELVTAVIDNNLDRFQADLDALEPKDRINAIIQLLKFNLPTLKAVEMHTIDEPTNMFNPVIIHFDERDKSNNVG